jgi:hypothetical protein
MSFNTLIGLATGLWLFTCAAGLLAIWWGVAAEPPKFRAGLVSSCLALGAGYLGISRFHFAASKTVNGHLKWSINSKWFFVGALILAAASLVLTLWKFSNRRREPQPHSETGAL